MRYWNTMNEAQRQSCKQLWEHSLKVNPPGWKESYLTFRRRFKLYAIGVDMPGHFFGGILPSGIFIGIETDGHAHS